MKIEKVGVIVEVLQFYPVSIGGVLRNGLANE